MLPVSVIVVSYNTRDLLRECLASVTDAAEVIVIDNASSDGSAEMVGEEFPRAQLILNTDNKGFGAANNQGLRVATQPYALLLNSDAAAHPGAIARLIEAMQDARRVVVGGKLVYPDGRFQLSAAHALTWDVIFTEQYGIEKLVKNYWIRSETPQEVGQVMGACLMMRRIDGRFMEFDEAMFLYCEDTELIHRLRAHGTVWYETSAVFTHHLGASSIENRHRSISLYNWGKEYYFRKHRGAGAAWLCWILDGAGAKLRMIAWALLAIPTLGRTWPRAQMWWKVVMNLATHRPGGPPPR